eukprot:22509-Alexandrium_andersonii.AAC.1
MAVSISALISITTAPQQHVFGRLKLLREVRIAPMLMNRGGRPKVASVIRSAVHHVLRYSFYHRARPLGD